MERDGTDARRADGIDEINTCDGGDCLFNRSGQESSDVFGACTDVDRCDLDRSAFQLWELLDR